MKRVIVSKFLLLSILLMVLVNLSRTERHHLIRVCTGFMVLVEDGMGKLGYVEEDCGGGRTAICCCPPPGQAQLPAVKQSPDMFFASPPLIALQGIHPY
jgi:hypothetical protein